VTHLPIQKRLFSFVTVKTLDPVFLAGLIGKRSGVTRVSLVDVFHGPSVREGYQKVSLMVEVPDAPFGRNALHEIETLLVGIGCVDS
jgi:ferredoxin-fold anticodon binding domain-containing protein